MIETDNRPANRLRTLVGRLLEGGVPELEHIQTVRIPQSVHHQLRALSEVTGHSKSALAGELLTAAIQDAIEALPDEPFLDGGATHPETGEPLSFRDMVRRRGEVLYREFLDQRGLEEHLAGHSVREDQ